MPLFRRRSFLPVFNYFGLFSHMTRFQKDSFAVQSATKGGAQPGPKPHSSRSQGKVKKGAALSDAFSGRTGGKAASTTRKTCSGAAVPPLGVGTRPPQAPLG